MRLHCLLLATLFCCIAGFAQKREEGFDYNFKPTQNSPRYYVITEKRGDLWHREAYYLPERGMAFEADFLDEACTRPHGKYLRYHVNKMVWEEGQYHNGLRHGNWLQYNQDGLVIDSAHYVNGRIRGVRLRWHANGTLADSMHIDEQGNGVRKTWYEDGALSSAGYLVQDTLKSGRWQYFHPNGKLNATEDYTLGECTNWACFDEQGVEMDTVLCQEREASFPGGAEGWRRFIEKKMDAHVPLRMGAPAGRYTVVVQFIIEKDGTLVDKKALTNFGYGMEQEVLRMLKNSPPWLPAQYHGVKRRAYRKQPVTFVVHR